MTATQGVAELLPCPFCGSANVDAEGWMSVNRDGTQKKSGPACDECGGSTETVERWNTRPLGDGVKRIEVDIGAAAAALAASPELVAMMNEMVGGPALAEAQNEIARLTSPVSKLEACRKALEDLARQKTTAELEGDGNDVGDLEYAYNAMILLARKALAAGG